MSRPAKCNGIDWDKLTTALAEKETPPPGAITITALAKMLAKKRGSTVDAARVWLVKNREALGLMCGIFRGRTWYWTPSSGERCKEN